MSKVEMMIATGVPFPAAVRAALEAGGESVRAFAERVGVAETTVSSLINGSTPYRYERARDALAAALDVDRAWLDEQMDRVRAAAAAA